MIMINPKYNYLTCGFDKLAEDYDYKNRPDPDRFSKILYDDLIEVFFMDLGAINKIQQFNMRDSDDPKKNNASWTQYFSLNKYDPEYFTKDEYKQPPFFTLVWKNFFLSADYIGPSVNWAEQRECSRETILNIMNVGRTIGGHIVWPRGKGETVNQARGGDKAFYDRIDWTLFVLKAYYECKRNNVVASGFVRQKYPQIEPHRYKLVLDAIERYSEWFSEFDDFPDFCDRFLLIDSFVNESYEIIWMAPANPMLPEDYDGYVQKCLDAIRKRNSAIMDKLTARYYDQSANRYFNTTVDADVRGLYEHFLKYVPNGAKILDLGCGSGRDAKAFLNMGYDVDAIDGSEELARIASEYTGIQVKCMDFNQLNESSVYDAIWTCASLLHVTSQDLPNIMARIRRALKPSGVAYASFKYGDFEGVRDDRYYTDMTSERFAGVLNKADGFSIVEEWYSDDVRAENNTVWYNVILRKV